ncbi:MAG: DsrE family protein [Nitrososphaerota archaeon]|nr:DsrE family protein [Nitrososphaerota archaeon]MDG6959472.1 DsrE family protein [Nitrososphaerota archaeon]MDG6966087.1 DsrE family protein [Nitrososphaerota archaeon]MDG6968046.1 DsrE family protein [Nitrososphaerota archaeon]MDG6969331.1 DsrE family protein [Nitrososphaerota archaeon]
MTYFGIILTGSPYQTQRWETACLIAEGALDRSDKVSFFLFMDGVYNALAAQRFPAMEELPKDRFASMIERGAEVFACEVCTNNRGLEEGAGYLKGVKVAGAAFVSEMVAKCDRVLTL